MIRGAITVDTAKALIDVINVRVKAIEVKDLEGRLAELEAAAQSVELGSRRRGGRLWGGG